MNTIGNLLTNLYALLCCVRETLGYALIFLWAIFCPKAVRLFHKQNDHKFLAQANLFLFSFSEVCITDMSA